MSKTPAYLSPGRMDDAKGQLKLYISLISVTSESPSGIFFCNIGVTQTASASTECGILLHFFFLFFMFSYSRQETYKEYKNVYSYGTQYVLNITVLLIYKIFGILLVWHETHKPTKI